MISYIYDGTFPGLLTAVFEVYERKESDLIRIADRSRYQPDVFAATRDIISDDIKAQRVWKGLTKNMSPKGVHNMYQCYLSEMPDREDIFLYMAQFVFSKPNEPVESYYNFAEVLRFQQIGKMVHREKHRFEAFTRFRKMDDGMFYAVIDPDYNVLPLIFPHFQRRYADQEWIIFDVRRKYGMFYDLQTVQAVELDNALPISKNIYYAEEQLDETEAFYQSLWKNYFKSTNIPARKNLKLHLRHVPHRYWKYLPEKQDAFR